MRRREFLGVLAAVLAGFADFASPVRAPAALLPSRPPLPGATAVPPSRPGQVLIDRLLGETLTYDMSFLWFQDAAAGSLRYFKNAASGLYMSILQAETKGFVGFVSGYRRHRYISTMSSQDGGRRLRSERFEIYIDYADQHWHSEHVMNYTAHKLVYKEWQNSKLTRDETLPIPPGVVYEDILSGFYNFRYGVYGPPIKGRSYTLNMLPRKHQSRFDVYLASDFEQQQEKTKLHLDVNASYLAFVVIPKEIFRTKTGRIRLWLDADLVPVIGTVEDAIGLGDVDAYLKSRKFLPQGS